MGTKTLLPTRLQKGSSASREAVGSGGLHRPPARYPLSTRNGIDAKGEPALRRHRLGPQPIRLEPPPLQARPACFRRLVGGNHRLPASAQSGALPGANAADPHARHRAHRRSRGPAQTPRCQRQAVTSKWSGPTLLIGQPSPAQAAAAVARKASRGFCRQRCGSSSRMASGPHRSGAPFRPSRRGLWQPRWRFRPGTARRN